MYPLGLLINRMGYTFPEHNLRYCFRIPQRGSFLSFFYLQLSEGDIIKIPSKPARALYLTYHLRHTTFIKKDDDKQITRQNF